MDARRRKLPGRQCVTEDFLLFGGLRALGLGVQGGGEAVVLVQRVFHISGEFGAYGFRQFVLYPVEVALRGLDPLIELSGESGLAQSDPYCLCMTIISFMSFTISSDDRKLVSALHALPGQFLTCDHNCRSRKIAFSHWAIRLPQSKEH